MKALAVLLGFIIGVVIGLFIVWLTHKITERSQKARTVRQLKHAINELYRPDWQSGTEG